MYLDLDRFKRENFKYKAFSMILLVILGIVFMTEMMRLMHWPIHLYYAFIRCLLKMKILNKKVLLYLIFLQQFEIVIIHYVRRNQRL